MLVAENLNDSIESKLLLKQWSNQIHLEFVLHIQNRYHFLCQCLNLNHQEMLDRSIGKPISSITNGINRINFCCVLNCNGINGMLNVACLINVCGVCHKNEFS